MSQLKLFFYEKARAKFYKILLNNVHEFFFELKMI